MIDFVLCVHSEDAGVSAVAKARCPGWQGVGERGEMAGTGNGGVLSSRGFLEGRFLMISIVAGVACGVIHYVSGHWPSGFLAAVAVSESAFLA